MKAFIIANDGLDLDVFKNIKYFYEACGYSLHLKYFTSVKYDLIIYLRGEITEPFDNFYGVVHIYDYVKNVIVDCSRVFPNSHKIYIVSLSITKNFSPQNNIIDVRGFLPIIPKLWVKMSFKKKLIPLHISHFKKMNRSKYQDELIELAESGEILIYGKRWSLKNISVRSISLSASTRKFRESKYSFGLMYDYQIGTTLSGRMWQAPLCGCYVFTEIGSNILSCPGVIEVESYKDTINEIKFRNFEDINIGEVILFWSKHTFSLAHNLNMKYDEKSKLSDFIFEIRFLFFNIKMGLRSFLQKV